MEDLIKTVSKLVDAEIEIELRESDDYGEVPDYDGCKDSFGDFFLRGHSEPEDAIWSRDLQGNYYTGLKLGIRNTIKVLRDNPALLKDEKI